MKRSLFLGVACLLGLSVTAQQDPVLMRINGKPVPRSEFEYIYNKNNSLSGLEPKTLNEYIDLFVNFKLKVAAAETARIDTTRTFREELDGYRAQLAKSYLTDEEAEEASAREAYNKMKASSRTGQVQVQHIFKSLPQTLSAVPVQKAEARMDSIYLALKSQPQADFTTFVQKYSDDKKKFWVGWLQMPEEFEKVAFSLQKGEISKPFYTPQGLHIVKLIDRKEMLPFEEMCEEIERRLARQQGLSKGTEALVEKLKADYGYTPNELGVEELLAKGETARILFTLDSREYTGTQFQHFAAAHPLGAKTQLNAFVIKSILDYENIHLEQKYPAFRLLMQEYKEGMLLFEISNREVWEKAMVDEAGLSAYFKLHKADYYWKQPRYRGIILHCTDKKVAKQARKLIRKLPESEWADAIRKTLNTSLGEVVKVEQGVFAEGDSKYVDKLVFRKGAFEPLKSYPFTSVWGKEQKGPDSYREVRGSLVADYQNFLDALWIKRLRTAGKVEINQEVLKTVNNH